MMDLEKTILYSLQHEVSIHKRISGKSLEALRNFISSLVNFLPVRDKVRDFLVKLDNYVITQNEIRGVNFSKKIFEFNQSDIMISNQHPWIGCLGSKTWLRGYPCGLWTMFHTMTVHGPSKPFKNTVLQSIHGYVKYFFGCSECSDHFQKMYSNDSAELVKSKDESILWLWRAHNKVNKRLRHAKTEDPIHIKEQFPNKHKCSKCWKNGKFNEQSVLNYLKVHYAKQNIIYKGIATQEKNPYENIDKQKNKQNPHSLRSMSNTWIFNKTDISLCVFLYALSTIIVIVVYFVVVIRRRRKKRLFMLSHKIV